MRQIQRYLRVASRKVLSQSTLHNSILPIKHHPLEPILANFIPLRLRRGELEVVQRHQRRAIRASHDAGEVHIEVAAIRLSPLVALVEHGDVEGTHDVLDQVAGVGEVEAVGRGRVLLPERVLEVAGAVAGPAAHREGHLVARLGAHPDRGRDAGFLGPVDGEVGVRVVQVEIAAVRDAAALLACLPPLAAVREAAVGEPLHGDTSILGQVARCLAFAFDAGPRGALVTARAAVVRVGA